MVSIFIRKILKQFKESGVENITLTMFWDTRHFTGC